MKRTRLSPNFAGNRESTLIIRANHHTRNDKPNSETKHLDEKKENRKATPKREETESRRKEGRKRQEKQAREAQCPRYVGSV